MDETTQKLIIEHFLEKDILLSPDSFEELNESNFKDTCENVNTKISSDDFVLLTKDIMHLLHKDTLNINWIDFDHFKTQYELNKNELPYLKFLEFLNSC